MELATEPDSTLLDPEGLGEEEGQGSRQNIFVCSPIICNRCSITEIPSERIAIN